jgi:hypothetical protein
VPSIFVSEEYAKWVRKQAKIIECMTSRRMTRPETCEETLRRLTSYSHPKVGLADVGDLIISGASKLAGQKPRPQEKT